MELEALDSFHGISRNLLNRTIEMTLSYTLNILI